MPISTMTPEAWKEMMDGACRAGAAWHERMMRDDPVYRATQERFAADYEAIFGAGPTDPTGRQDAGETVIDLPR